MSCHPTVLSLVQYSVPGSESGRCAQVCSFHGPQVQGLLDGVWAGLDGTEDIALSFTLFFYFFFLFSRGLGLDLYADY